MKNAFLTCAVALMTATTALADIPCGERLSNDDLVGNYTITLGPGTLTANVRNGQRVHPVPPITGTATIALYDGVPILFSTDVAEGGDLEISIVQANINNKDMGFLDDVAFPIVSIEDAAIIAGCENGVDLPQLIGTGSVTGNGVVIPNSTRLVVFEEKDGDISAMGSYLSTFSPPGSDVVLEFHVKILLVRN